LRNKQILKKFTDNNTEANTKQVKDILSKDKSKNLDDLINKDIDNQLSNFKSRLNEKKKSKLLSVSHNNIDNVYNIYIY
jgi:hypothetical protein